MHIPRYTVDKERLFTTYAMVVGERYEVALDGTYSIAPQQLHSRMTQGSGRSGRPSQREILVKIGAP